jgi:hypothetical protein
MPTTEVMEVMELMELSALEDAQHPTPKTSPQTNNQQL